jgi:hypothetical protein
LQRGRRFHKNLSTGGRSAPAPTLRSAEAGAADIVRQWTSGMIAVRSRRAS